MLEEVADALPLDDASIDAGVCSLVLCSVPSQATALAELRRGPATGGEARFYEHVRAETPSLARLQRAADLRAAADRGRLPHHRDTLRAIERGS